MCSHDITGTTGIPRFHCENAPLPFHTSNFTSFSFECEERRHGGAPDFCPARIPTFRSADFSSIFRCADPARKSHGHGQRVQHRCPPRILAKKHAFRQCPASKKLPVPQKNTFHAARRQKRPLGKPGAFPHLQRPAMALNRATRSLMSGCVLNNRENPPPNRGATMNSSAVVGLPCCMGTR